MENSTSGLLTNETISTIYKRRSVRRYSEKQISDADLMTIVEAGRVAPSGGNSQSTHIIVIQKKEVLDELVPIAQKAFASMEITENTYSSIRNSITASKKGSYIFHYGCPTLVVVANKKGYGNAMADCSCVLQNMMLAAASIDVANCWINQLHWLDEEPTVRQYMLSLGLGEDETVCGALALGYIAEDTAYPAPIVISGNPVTFVK